MPYDSIKDIPAWVLDFGEKAARRWMHVFSSVWDTVINKGGTKKEAEEKAFKAANASLPKKKNAEASSRLPALAGYEFSAEARIEVLFRGEDVLAQMKKKRTKLRKELRGLSKVNMDKDQKRFRKSMLQDELDRLRELSSVIKKDASYQLDYWEMKDLGFFE